MFAHTLVTRINRLLDPKYGRSKKTHIRVLMLLYIAHHSWSCRHWPVTNYMMMKFLQVVSLLVLDVSMGKFNKKERKRYDTEINLL